MKSWIGLIPILLLCASCEKNEQTELGAVPLAAQILVSSTPDKHAFRQAVETIEKEQFLSFDGRRANRPDPEAMERHASIDGERILQNLKELTEFSLQSKADGNALWGRIAGSKYERLATEYVEKEFLEYGLENVRIEEFPLTNGDWQPSAVSLEVMSEQADKTLTTLNSAATAYPSGTTPTEGLVGKLEYVGLGTPADLRGRDLSGKIALLHVRVFDGVLLHSGLASAKRIATNTNAAGMILWMDLPGNSKHATQLYTPEGFVEQIPWVSIGFEDGLYLRKLIESLPQAQAPSVKMTVTGELRTEGTSQNLVAELPGTSNETLILTAHIDGYWSAVLDNGTGVAALMELARYYAGLPVEQRKRRLIFLITGDHEMEGAGGSVVFAARHPDIMSSAALAIQFEHLAGPGTINFLNSIQFTNASAPLKAFVSNSNGTLLDILRDTADQYGLVVTNLALRGTAGDVDGLGSIPSIGFIQTGYLYHSAVDEVSFYSAKELELAARAHAFMVDEVNRIDAAEMKRAVGGDVIPFYVSPSFYEMLSSW